MNKIPQKHVHAAWLEIANCIARQPMDQTVREALAADVGGRLGNLTLFSQHFGATQRETFVGLASDPLVPCVGYTNPDTDESFPCPEDRVIRVYARRRFGTGPNEGEPIPFDPSWVKGIRCSTCGAKTFMPDFLKNVEARS